MDLLAQIAALSQEFGQREYVRGGGGNTSAKDASTLWIKPSGITMAELTPDAFVALDRSRMARLYSAEPPEAPAAREALVKELMMAAIRENSGGRPSVESPLHNSFDARFVVHTHPALVNGMTCSRNGAAVCREFFPDALWIEYVDPGYTLSMVVRARVQDYAKQHGRQPGAVFIENHGVFVTGDTTEDVRATYRAIMTRLTAAYNEHGIALELPVGTPPPPDAAAALEARVRALLGDDATRGVAVAAPFRVPRGPITPDHIVYMKSYALIGEPTTESCAAFASKHGYSPRVIETPQAVIGIGASAKAAALAIELAEDGALIEQLADAFGGIQYMSDRARDFIDNWEVEAYRRKQMGA